MTPVLYAIGRVFPGEVNLSPAHLVPGSANAFAAIVGAFRNRSRLCSRRFTSARNTCFGITPGPAMLLRDGARAFWIVHGSRSSTHRRAIDPVVNPIMHGCRNATQRLNELRFSKRTGDRHRNRRQSGGIVGCARARRFLRARHHCGARSAERRGRVPPRRAARASQAWTAGRRPETLFPGISDEFLAAGATEIWTETWRSLFPRRRPESAAA
jgi:hypothetical protein